MVNQLREEVLNLAPEPWSYYTNIDVSKVPILYGYSKYVLPKPADWGDHLHVTGYWFVDDPSRRPPQELTHFLEGGPPPIYIGFGSMVDAEAKKTTDIVLAALQITGQRAILHGGWSDLGATHLPDDVYKVGDIPHGWLFPRMAAIVHHGGAGTTAAALRAVVPAVIVPYFADQPFWARHVYQLGASPKPIPREKLTASNLAVGIQEALQDDAVQREARILGEKIHAENGVEQAVELIENYLNDPKVLMQFNP